MVVKCVYRTKRLVAQSLVRAARVIKRHVRVDEIAQMRFPKDDEMVKAFCFGSLFQKPQAEACGYRSLSRFASVAAGFSLRRRFWNRL